MVFSNLSVHLKGYVSDRNQVLLLKKKKLTVAKLEWFPFQRALYPYYLCSRHINATSSPVLLFIGLDT